MCRLAAFSLQALVDSVADDAAQPRAEFVRFAQRPEVCPRGKERFLSHVLALLTLPVALSPGNRSRFDRPTICRKASRLPSRLPSATRSASLVSIVCFASIVIISRIRARKGPRGDKKSYPTDEPHSARGRRRLSLDCIPMTYTACFLRGAAKAGRDERADADAQALVTAGRLGERPRVDAAGNNAR